MHRLTLSSISANVSLSSSYLCRVFKSEVGTSITSYLNNLRIRKAATMIKDNRLSLKEISTMVGTMTSSISAGCLRNVWEFLPRNTGNDFISKSQKGMKPQI